MTGYEVIAALRQDKRQLEQKVLSMEERLRKVTEFDLHIHTMIKSCDALATYGLRAEYCFGIFASDTLHDCLIT